MDRLVNKVVYTFNNSGLKVHPFMSMRQCRNYSAPPPRLRILHEYNVKVLKGILRREEPQSGSHVKCATPCIVGTSVHTPNRQAASTFSHVF